MILSDWIYVIGFVAFWVVLYKLTHRKKLRLSPRRMIQYLDSIDDLHDTAQKYRQIENMIIEINNVNRKHLRGINIEIPNFLNSQTESYNFVCGGGFKTNKFKKILEQERIKLLDELVAKTRQLDKRKVTTSILKRWGDFRDKD